MSRILVRLGFLLLPLAVLVLPAATFADEPRQAGLVIQFGDGHVETRCVTFEEEITGADLLLTYSGLDAVVDASSGLGISVCQIETEGCLYPTEHCFCQCMGGGECAYWNYFYLEPGSDQWTYSALGAVLRKVQHGSVEAWVWGDGTTPPTFDGTFESICAEPTATPTTEPTTQPAATPEPPTATPTAMSTLPAMTQAPEPTHTPQTSATPTSVPPIPTQTPAPTTTQSLVSYWPFGLMVLGLAAVGLWVRSRRGR